MIIVQITCSGYSIICRNSIVLLNSNDQIQHVRHNQIKNVRQLVDISNKPCQGVSTFEFSGISYLQQETSGQLSWRSDDALHC